MCRPTEKYLQIYTPILMYILVNMSSQPCIWKVTAGSMNVVIFIVLIIVLIIGACWKIYYRALNSIDNNMGGEPCGVNSW